MTASYQHELKYLIGVIKLMSLSAKYRGRNKPKSISQMIYENVIVMFFILSRLVLFCFNLELFMY